MKNCRLRSQEGRANFWVGSWITSHSHQWKTGVTVEGGISSSVSYDKQVNYLSPFWERNIEYQECQWKKKKVFSASVQAYQLFLFPHFTPWLHGHDRVKRFAVHAALRRTDWHNVSIFWADKHDFFPGGWFCNCIWAVSFAYGCQNTCHSRIYL